MGYSQGGALAALTVAKFKNLVCKDPSYPSITFHAPAVRYDKISGLNLRQYVIKGDIISRVGHTWLGDVYQIEYNRMQTFLNPHFTITLAQPGWRCQKIDAVQDELSPSRNILFCAEQGEVQSRILRHDRYIPKKIDSFKYDTHSRKNLPAVLVA